MAQIVKKLVVDVEIRNKARRDMFAAAAMQALCSSANGPADFVKAGSSLLDEISASSVKLADAIIAELDNLKPEAGK